jgi:hypothetical protein
MMNAPRQELAVEPDVLFVPFAAVNEIAIHANLSYATRQNTHTGSEAPRMKEPLPRNRLSREHLLSALLPR